jgi:hypothetical protein
LVLLQQQTLDHQVQEAAYLLQLHLKQVLLDQLEDQEEQVDHIVIAVVQLLLDNKALMVQQVQLLLHQPQVLEV